MSPIQLKKDLLLEGSNRYHKIRNRARTIAFNSYLNPKCSICNYDKHVEVCHIKAIKDFDMETPVSIINDISNLELLCPNCHWEKDHPVKKEINKCLCDKEILRDSKKCHKCASVEMAKHRTTKRIPKEELELLVNKYPMTTIGKMIGVCDNTVKKWCKFYEIELGNRSGYWAKKRCQEKNGDGVKIEPE